MLNPNNILIAQIAPQVGAISQNLDAIINIIRGADKTIELIIFPEMAITGYPLQDLANGPDLQASASQANHELQEQYRTGKLSTPALIGGLHAHHSRPLNTATLYRPHVEPETFIKNHLHPLYEQQNFLPAHLVTQSQKPNTFTINNTQVGVIIGDDIQATQTWPYSSFKPHDAELIVILNNSPYSLGQQYRRAMQGQKLALATAAQVIYVNQVGGQDDNVFDGQSLVIDAQGNTKQLPGFASMITKTHHANIHAPTLNDMSPHLHTNEQLSDIWSALTMGLRDYIKHSGLKKIVLGVSGGIDSAIVAAVAADAIGGRNIIALSMPSPYSSQGSLDDAQELAQAHNMDYRVMPITPAMQTFNEKIYQHTGIAEENLQARLRALTLMSVSNTEHALVLACDNKTEIAVGYSTIYGDTVGGYAPIRDLLKTTVWELAKWRNAQAAHQGEITPIPKNSISKPASAELSSNQSDEQELPPYETLDDIIDMYIYHNMSYEAIANKHGESVTSWTLSAIKNAEWKRQQYPLGPKISQHSFSKDRQIPIMNHWTH